MLTLGALTIAIGRVVDDSIVVLENIKRHLGYGEERQRGDPHRGQGGGRRGHPSTLTTVAVFLPDRPGRRHGRRAVRPFALTVTVALLASLLVSLTVIPVLAYWFLRAAQGHRRRRRGARRAAQAEEKEAASRLQRPTCRCCASPPGAGSPAWSSPSRSWSAPSAWRPLLKTNFFDQGEQDALTVTQELPVGTSLAATDEAARKVEEVLADDQGVEDYQVTVGSSGFLAAFGGGRRQPGDLPGHAEGLGGPATTPRSGSTDGTRQARRHRRRSRVAARRRLRQPGPERRREGRRRRSVLTEGAPSRSGAEVAGSPTSPTSKRPGAERARASRCTANDKAAAAGLDQATLGASRRRRPSAAPRPARRVLDDTERDVVIRSGAARPPPWPS